MYTGVVEELLLLFEVAFQPLSHPGEFIRDAGGELVLADDEELHDVGLTDLRLEIFAVAIVPCSECVLDPVADIEIQVRERPGVFDTGRRRCSRVRRIARDGNRERRSSPCV